MTLVGVPGIGKSRLVSELFETIRRPERMDSSPGERALAAVRRGRHLLGARRDRQGAGRHSRVRSARRRRRRSSARPSSRFCPTRQRQAGSSATCGHWPGSRQTRRQATRRERGVRGVAALSRGDRRRTSARPRLRGSPLGRRRDARLRRLPRRAGEERAAARRSAPHGRSSSRDVPVGAAAR